MLILARVHLAEILGYGIVIGFCACFACAEGEFVTAAGSCSKMDPIKPLTAGAF